ncbi:hypothetical protein BDR03DRAFT_969709 [Suillus americanus]|nr:hypothetical protein BDR03DRAFT_969709 [Suillus americanus]
MAVGIQSREWFSRRYGHRKSTRHKDSGISPPLAFLDTLHTTCILAYRLPQRLSDVLAIVNDIQYFGTLLTLTALSTTLMYGPIAIK